MMFNLVLTCYDLPAGAFLGLFDFLAPTSLLFYAYFPVVIISIILGVFVLISDKYSLKSKLFLSLTIIFSVLLLNEVVQWIAGHVGIIQFSWQIVPLFRILVVALVVYFSYIFINNKSMPLLQMSILTFFIMTTLVFLPTKFNIANFDFNRCESISSYLWWFVNIAGIVSAFWIMMIAFLKHKSKKGVDSEWRQLAFFAGGTALFMLTFFGASMYADIFRNFYVGLVGSAGMVLFLGVLSYMMVKFKTFNTKLFASQILVVALGFLIGALLFIQKIEYIHIVVWVTLGLVAIVGYQLVKSVKREIMLREDLEIANEKLKGLDKLKSEFLSLASHQLRSPLTAIKGYSSMLSEGSFGDLNTGVKEIVNRIFESSNNMALMVEDFLNVSKIEQGGMKYEKINFDFAEVVSEEAKDFAVVAGGKGLVLNYTQDNFKHTVFGDKEKLRQVVINFIDNSIKYTEKGSIEVSVTNKNGKIIFAVKDTGRGISPKEKEALFQKFSRGSGAKVNTTGSGLGLYLAKEIVTAHDGNIGIESDGEGKGSTFFVELPVV